MGRQILLCINAISTVCVEGYAPVWYQKIGLWRPGVRIWVGGGGTHGLNLLLAKDGIKLYKGTCPIIPFRYLTFLSNFLLRRNNTRLNLPVKVPDTARPLRIRVGYVICFYHVSRITYHTWYQYLPCITYHVPYVIWYLSRITYHISRTTYHLSYHISYHVYVVRDLWRAKIQNSLFGANAHKSWIRA